MDSPYKLIAADINNDQKVNGLDLVELRKMVLGTYTEFPDNDSWRFVRSDFVFDDPSNPWLNQMPEEYFIPELVDNMAIDFIGVKIGDVDNSVFSLDDNSHTGKRSIFDFNAEQLTAQSGDIIEINVSSTDYEEILGWQGTITFDESALEIIEIVPHAIASLSGLNANIEKQREGWMTMSYSNELPESYTNGDVLFQVIAQVKRPISNTQNLLSLSSAQLSAEAYSETLDVIPMGNSKDADIETASLLSVSPNPWYNRTTIDFETVTDSETRIEFYDASGRLLHQIVSVFNIGKNSLEINRNDLNASGLIYIRLISDGQSSESKMMLLE